MNKSLFQGFIKRDGMHIMYTTFAGRILSFLASLLALKLIPDYELGLVIYAQNVLALLIPITGFGAMQGLLRFGALTKTKSKIQQLFGYTLQKGIRFSSVLIIFVVIFSGFLTYNLKEARFYLIVLSLQLITLFILENLKTYYRVIHQNKKFAQVELTYNIFLIVLIFIGSYFFKDTGYVIALIITPLITSLIFYPEFKLQFIKNIPIKESKKDFWSYSFYAGLSNVASQFLIVIDIILIGTLLKDPEKITLYKYLSIIPFSLLFLPRILLTTDFVSLTKQYKNKTYIVNYIKNYMQFFSIVSIFFVFSGWILSTQILQLFGNEFINYQDVFVILLIGISGILIIRGLFGNLLSVIGKAHVNFWISIIGIIINTILNYILIPKFGLLGAAITSASIMWITSLISLFVFYLLYKKAK